MKAAVTSRPQSHKFLGLTEETSTLSQPFVSPLSSDRLLRELFKHHKSQAQNYSFQNIYIKLKSAVFSYFLTQFLVINQHINSKQIQVHQNGVKDVLDHR